MADAEMRDRLAFSEFIKGRSHRTVEWLRKEWAELPAYDREAWWLRASRRLDDKLDVSF